MDNRDPNAAGNVQAEAVRTSADATRRAGETAQNSMRAGLDTATQALQQITDQFTRTLGFAEPQTQELARKSRQNFHAVTQATSVLAQGAGEISREWFGLAQAGLKKNMDGFGALARCRSVQDFVAVQSELVRENLQCAMDNTRRLSEASVRVAQHATRTMQNSI